MHSSVQFSHSVVSDSVTPWTAVHQASVSITNPWSLLKLRSIESVMPSNHLIFCHLLLPSIFPSIKVFSSESVLCIRWPKYWSFTCTQLYMSNRQEFPLKYTVIPLSYSTKWPIIHSYSIILRLYSVSSVITEGFVVVVKDYWFSHHLKIVFVSLKWYIKNKRKYRE